MNPALVDIGQGPPLRRGHKRDLLLQPGLQPYANHDVRHDEISPAGWLRVPLKVFTRHTRGWREGWDKGGPTPLGSYSQLFTKRDDPGAGFPRWGVLRGEEFECEESPIFRPRSSRL